MNFKIVTAKPESYQTSALVACIFEGVSVKNTQLSTLDRKLHGLITDVISSKEFSGKRKTSVVLHPINRVPAKRIVLVGAGTSDGFSSVVLREASATASRKLKDLKSESAAFVVPDLLQPEDEGRSIAEGIVLGLYAYDEYKTDRSEIESAILRRVDLLTGKSPRSRELSSGAQEGRINAEATNECRDLVNCPSNDLTPVELAARAKKLCAGTGVRVTVWNRERIERERMGAILAVSQGSAREPRFIILEHKPAGVRSRPIALVGKAVTFDTGGVDIKTRTGMEDMKCDMAGGATVLATLAACGRRRIRQHVLGYIPATENMPSGTAIKPGDVVRARNGKTIEILNTDAEGRLILADALVLACERKPQAIVDLATLTGACIVALGDIATGLMATHQSLVEELICAGEASGERVWQLPMWDDYLEHVKSHVADVKNMGKSGEAGAIAGAAFLHHFVKEGIPWAHLDIAGPSFVNEDRILHPRGATGWGVNLLLQLLDGWGGTKAI